MDDHQINWIKNASEDQKKSRAMIVGWQNSQMTVNELVKHFNNLLKNEDERPHGGMREIAIKKVIIASVLELKGAVDNWVSYLNQAGVDTEEINRERRASRAILEKAERFRRIRNTTFHYADIMTDADELVDIYEEVKQWSNEQVQEIIETINRIGELAKTITRKTAD